jgi:hypothetical protein
MKATKNAALMIPPLQVVMGCCFVGATLFSANPKLFSHLLPVLAIPDLPVLFFHDKSQPDLFHGFKLGRIRESNKLVTFFQQPVTIPLDHGKNHLLELVLAREPDIILPLPLVETLIQMVQDGTADHRDMA